MPTFQLKINGKSQTVEADRDTPLPANQRQLL